MIRALLCSAVVICCAGSLSAAETLPVEIVLEKAGSRLVAPGISRARGDLAPPAPRPERSGTRLRYRFAFLTGSMLDFVPLAITYLDRRAGRGIGIGWTIELEAETGLTVDLLDPDREIEHSGGSRFLLIDGRRLPLAENSGPARMPLPEGGALVFSVSDNGSARPSGLETADGREIGFRFDASGRWMGLETAVGDLSLVKDETSVRFVLEAGGDRRRLDLILSPGDPGTRLLTGVVSDFIPSRPQHLDFSYRPVAGLSAPLCDGPASRHWVRSGSRSDPSRFKLPENLDVRFDDGIEFMAINRDDFIDFVSSSDRRPLMAYLGQRGGGWRLHPLYKTPRAHSKAGLQLGSRFTGVWKDFSKPFKRKRDTKGFSAILESFYQPDPADPQTRLQLRRRVHFPVVDANRGVIDVDEAGRSWTVDANPALVPPIPFQFEGFGAFSTWPRGDNSLESAESARNQGALLLEYNGKPAVQFAGLCYRDAGTREVLLSEHRCTGNCQFRYQDTWGDRKVDVSLCQAVWLAASQRWVEGKYDPKTKPFWIRRDFSEESGQVFPDFTLPWGDGNPATDDRFFRYHLEGMRNVRFISLLEGQRHVLIAGKASLPTAPEDIRRPDARLILRLNPNTDVWEPSDERLLPPEAALDSPAMAFVDINGDGLDDIVANVDRKPVVFVNQAATVPERPWRLCPAYQLPRVCFEQNRCRFVALDGQPGNDILVDDGTIVFLNSAGASPVRPGMLVGFPDADGETISR
ncbi:MAG: hypothetical protein AAGF59_06195 [Pseudomonadota bacterium]